MMKLIFVSCAIIFTFSSCWSNAFYFDIAHHTLISKSPKGIRYISIENDSIPEKFSISWVDDHNAPRTINLDAIDNAYYVTKNGREIENKDFKLSSFSTYKIERAQGDAGSYFIMVLTDASGKVVESQE